MAPTVSVSQPDWSLHRKAPKDQARHQEKVRETIKNNLGDIIADESIITSDGSTIVKVPVRSLEEYAFRFDPFKKDGVGQGSGGSQPGDVLGRLPGQEPGRGRQAGNEPGIDYYEAEISIDEIAEMIFADLGLPNLKEKGAREISSERLIYNDIRQKGILPNLDKRRTIMQALKRAAASTPVKEGVAAPYTPALAEPGLAAPETPENAERHVRLPKLRREDLRYKSSNVITEMQRNAVVVAMRDISGSMGEFEKYISRSFYFWMVRFLRTRYSQVEIVFIVHHTEARTVDEQAFFTLGEGGGTRVSSAYQLCLETIDSRFPPALWNIYPFHFSDGDNWGTEDNQRCVALVHQLIERCNLFGYGEIQDDAHSRWGATSLMSAFSAISAPEFVSVTIKSKEDVYPALRTFFRQEEPMS